MKIFRVISDLPNTGAETPEVIAVHPCAKSRLRNAHGLMREEQESVKGLWTL